MKEKVYIGFVTDLTLKLDSDVKVERFRINEKTILSPNAVRPFIKKLYPEPEAELSIGLLQDINFEDGYLNGTVVFKERVLISDSYVVIIEADKNPISTTKKEEKTMNKNIFQNLGFGKVNDDQFKLSMNGIAVKTKDGGYQVYNLETNEFVDVTEMLFDFKQGLFIMPTVEVAVGDLIIHAKKPYFIVDVTNEIKAVSFEDSTQTVLIPRSTMFGIKFFTKVHSMLGDFTEGSDLFKNPMVMMSMLQGDGDDSMDKMLLMSSLASGDMASNPMLLAMMMGDKDKGMDMTSLAMMSSFNSGVNPFASKKDSKSLNKKTEKTQE